MVYISISVFRVYIGYFTSIPRLKIYPYIGCYNIYTCVYIIHAVIQLFFIQTCRIDC
ncbi:hypothetical protein HanRHA438_Chr05g0236471 [Helianthus annuus]|nr:hypothetical protein HanRHA438_Chr05g0236471 [Helianthus annuus]